MSRGYDARRKARRQEARAAAKLPRRRPSPSRRLVAVLPVLAIAAIFAATAVLGFGASEGTSRKQVKKEVTSLLAGIPQDGITLGSSRAPLTLEVFGDLECPTVRLFVENYLSSVINTWVRAGTLNLTYHSLKTDTDDERTFFRQEAAALAAGRQDKMWNFVLTFVREQGQAHTGYVTSQFLASIAAQVPSLKRAQWHDELEDSLLFKKVALSVHAAHVRKLDFTPSFLIRLNGDEADESVLDHPASARHEFFTSFKTIVETLDEEALEDAPQVGFFNVN